MKTKRCIDFSSKIREKVMELAEDDIQGLCNDLKVEVDLVLKRAVKEEIADRVYYLLKDEVAKVQSEEEFRTLVEGTYNDESPKYLEKLGFRIWHEEE